MQNALVKKKNTFKKTFIAIVFCMKEQFYFLYILIFDVSSDLLSVTTFRCKLI